MSPALPPRLAQRPSRRLQRSPRIGLQGQLWLDVNGEALGSPEHLALLRAVADSGSIAQAAKAVGTSYKTAWTAIDAMNQRAGTPLVERATGGTGGGGTQLTAHGQRLLSRFEALLAVHARFVAQLADQGLNLDEPLSLLQVVNMKTSARNQWLGTVCALRAGTVSDEVELQLAGGGRLVATVTRDSTDALDLRVKQPVVALVKSSAVTLAVDWGGARSSARNRYDGTVVEVRSGAVNTEVTLETPEGLRIVAVVTQASVEELGLAPGRAATALIKASDVILACSA